MVEIMHTTIFLDEIKEEKSKRRLGDYLTGQIEYNNRFDYENDVSSEKYYYPSGALKTEISTQAGKVVSEIYYLEKGKEITKQGH